MHNKAITLIMALGFANPAPARSPHRLIVVVSAPDDPRAAVQRAALDGGAPALHERDVLVQNLTPDAARHSRPELGVEPDAIFEVLLVGKDGGVKLRRGRPVAVSELTALIDTMPMRRDEMRRQPR